MSEPSDQPPMLEYRNPETGPVRKTWPAIVGIGLAIAVVLIVGMVFLAPLLQTRRPGHSPRIYCGLNLRQLGQAMRMYAIDDVRLGRFPPNWETLLANSDLVPEIFICPASAAIDAPPPFVLGVNCSYVYLASGMTDNAPAATPVAYCEPHNHGSEGTNVLYADGSTRFLPPDQFPPEVQPTKGP